MRRFVEVGVTYKLISDDVDDLRKHNGINRCAFCSKFCAWEELLMFSHTPDNHFGGEETVYICWYCRDTRLQPTFEHDGAQ